MSDTVTADKSVFSIEYTPRLQQCIQCGDCSGVCPFGYLMEYPPSRIIAALRANALDHIATTDTVWMCISCSACSTVCPADIPVTENLMTRIKEEMILAGNIPEELQSALEYSQRYGNPLGESPRKRADWAVNISPPIQIMGKEKKETDILWFVGDYASYHPRAIPSSQAMAKILHALEVDFGILGRYEHSDGDSQRLVGERGLFEMLAEKNGKAFSKYNFKKIITTDPHAYNVIKNEYPKLDISYPVEHYTEFLANKIETLQPFLKNNLDLVVTYHDPCYLGRVNGIYDAPRILLEAIPGLNLVEMPHHHSTSLCCGGGGGGTWLDGFHWEKAHTRLSEWRIKEALKVGANTLAVACPYEIPRFEDAIKTLGVSDKLIVKDIAELIVEAM